MVGMGRNHKYLKTRIWRELPALQLAETPKWNNNKLLSWSMMAAKKIFVHRERPGLQDLGIGIPVF